MNNDFSAEELRLINNTRFFKLKAHALQKIEARLSILGEGINELLMRHQRHLPVEVIERSPKISRGEAYKGLPWMVLDHPRIFAGNDVFAFRSLFWWGHHFSFTIYIGGNYYNTLREVLLANVHGLGSKKFFLGVNKDPWQHDFEESNYRLIDELSNREISAILAASGFIKLARKLPLNAYAGVTDYGLETYRLFLEITKNQREG